MRKNKRNKKKTVQPLNKNNKGADKRKGFIHILVIKIEVLMKRK